MIELTPHPQGVVLKVRAQPGARKNAVLGERAGAVRVAVSAAPEKGKANAAILEVLADGLGCKGSQVVLVSGETARDKKVLVVGLAPEEVRERLNRLTEKTSADDR
ncbi:MAG: DUF167 domain-containing protein [Isosphaeraceae bacterium]